MSEAVAFGLRGGERSGVRLVRLRIPAKPEYVAVARLAAAGLAEMSNATDEALVDLRLAVTEAVLDSIRPSCVGYTGDVQLAFELDGTWLEVVVTGDGAGFGEEHLCPADRDERMESTTRLAVIQALTEEFEIAPQSSSYGSRLRFVKHLRDPH
ncbi:MAG TPA: ATP-binding protein [Gaiellaceae bacterium]|nr:ATP-binding protein [Gaiellaceae bacterium]